MKVMIGFDPVRRAFSRRSCGLYVVPVMAEGNGMASVGLVFVGGCEMEIQVVDEPELRYQVVAELSNNRQSSSRGKHIKIAGSLAAEMPV
jgi:hypothetical protein